MNYLSSDRKKLRKYFYMEFVQKVLPVKKQLDKYISTKKLVIGVLCFLVFLLYLWPLFKTRRKYVTGFCSSCLQRHLYLYGDDNNMDLVIQHLPKVAEDKDYTPFIGNGYMGLFYNSLKKEFFVKLTKLLSVPIAFNPISNIHLEQHESQDIIVTNYRKGVVHHLKCIKYNLDCVFSDQSILMHRTFPSLFIEKILVENPLDRVLELEIKHAKLDPSWIKDQETNHNSILKDASQLSPLQMEVTRCAVYGLKVAATSLNAFPLFRFLHSQDLYLYAEFMFIKPKMIKVPPRSKSTSYGYTIFRYSLFSQNPTPLQNQSIAEGLKKLVDEDLNSIFKFKPEELLTLHFEAWNEVWKTGLSMSHSKSATALNGDRINATFYTFLSHQPTHPDPIQASLQQSVTTAVAPAIDFYPKDHCYNSHSTMLSSTLWSQFGTVAETLRIMYLWELTLDKNGCSKLIQSQGLTGTIEALTFSAAGLKITSNHLEFSMDPKDLHRDMTIRHINYKNLTYVSIQVFIGDDNRAFLLVSIDPTTKTPLYACDAGCLDPLIALSTSPSQFPVKLTSPLTSLLYISEDRDHLDYLKHTIHVKEIVIAPAHEHHVIAAHKHGHNFGGLPTFFWVSIALLIVLFHLFLFKLIYSEYCGTSSDYYRDRYSV